MTSTETLAQPPTASPDPIPNAWAMLRMMVALLLQPHRWGELAALERTLESALADAIKAQLLALPELAHLRHRLHTVRAVWRGHRLDFEAFDADGRSLLDPSSPNPDDPRAILQDNLRTARLWLDHRRTLCLIGRLRGLSRNPLHRGRMIACRRRQRGFRVRRFRAAGAALRGFSQSLRVATLAVVAPP